LVLITVNINWDLILDIDAPGFNRYGDMVFSGGQCPYIVACGAVESGQIVPGARGVGCKKEENDKIELLDLNAKNYLGKAECWVGTIICVYVGLMFCLWCLLFLARQQERHKRMANDERRTRGVYKIISEIAKREMTQRDSESANRSKKEGSYITMLVLALVVGSILPLNIVQQVRPKTEWLGDSSGSYYEPTVNGTSLWLLTLNFPEFSKGSTPEECRSAFTYWSIPGYLFFPFTCDDLLWLTWGNSTRWTDCFGVSHPSDKFGLLHLWLTSQTSTMAHYISIL
jgi:hypothetical protein